MSYVHKTLIFNAFVFCQLFNEFNARNLFDEVNCFSGLMENPIFIAVIFITVILQYAIVTFGGEWTRTSPLTQEQWMITVAFGLISFPVGFFMRFIPCPEDEADFFVDTTDVGGRNDRGYGYSSGGSMTDSMHSQAGLLANPR